MTKYMKHSTLRALFEAVEKLSANPLPAPNPEDGVYDEILDQGFATNKQLTQLLTAFGVPEQVIPDLYDYLEVTTDTYYKNPEHARHTLQGFAGYGLAIVSRILMFLERLGFQSNPMPAAVLVYDNTFKNHLFTIAELDCHRYEEERGKFKLYIPGIAGIHYEAKHLTAHGYLLKIHEYGLHVTGPLEIFTLDQEFETLEVK